MVWACSRTRPGIAAVGDSALPRLRVSLSTDSVQSSVGVVCTAATRLIASVFSTVAAERAVIFAGKPEMIQSLARLHRSGDQVRIAVTRKVLTARRRNKSYVEISLIDWREQLS